MELDEQQLHKSLEGTVNMAVTTRPNSKQAQTKIYLVENPETFYMIEGELRIDSGETVRLHLPPTGNPRTLLAIEILNDEGQPKYIYAGSVEYLK